MFPDLSVGATAVVRTHNQGWWTLRMLGDGGRSQVTEGAESVLLPVFGQIKVPDAENSDSRALFGC